MTCFQTVTYVGFNTLIYLFIVCVQLRLRSTRRSPYRESSSWCIAPTKLWLFGGSSVNISSASSCPSCQRYTVTLVFVANTSDSL